MLTLNRAQSALVTSNLKLAHKLANVYGRGSEDAHADAMEGLCIAAAKYDPAHGVAFGAFASYEIRAKVSAGKRKSTTVHTGNTRAGRALYGALPGIRAKLERAGVDVTADSIATESGFDADEVRAVLRAVDGTASLSAPTGSEDGDTIADLLVSEDATPEADLDAAQQTALAHALVAAFAATLKPGTLAWSIWHENLTVDGDDAATLETLAGRFGLSKQRAGQIAKTLRSDFRAFVEAHESRAVAA